MKRASVAAAAALVVMGAAPAKGPPPPVANYWMDVTTTSGFGAGMAGGGAQPDMAQVMAMLSGRGGGVGHTIDLRLASKTKAPAAASADHWIPPALQMGLSLPLVTPARPAAEPRADGLPAQWQQPKGRMLIYWGCGEHVTAGQPTVIDFAKMVAGKMPPGMAAMASAARVVSGPYNAPGFGKWPNDRDSRAVPATGSLIGAHRIAGNYSPEIAFSLGAGQDFMGGLNLTEAGTLPSGAARLAWQAVPNATGYALAMFGANPNGDMIMWSSAKTAGMATLDYLAPAEVKRLIGTGAVLPPSTNQCVLPAEVAAAVPTGMITMIGYGPEANFSDDPKAPKWTAKVRYKTTASLMRGMQGMMGSAGMGQAEAMPPPQVQPQQPRRKRKRSLLGDIIEGATGIPTGQ
ncbi:hypothetical protein H9L13_02545 [Sphingomonas lutea]|uniref:Uncharacterized protein n=1 Tax=Sphingomonas lutea TaxID=1045317 RepID=A0A7G9SJ02_9SPHN|nr:hypothetical protein [Sphingomonas lutea]QNN67827.1 hypothetical protein H9L13_02545 [Sphingomonas lutea]